MILVPSFDIPSGFRLGKITEECPFQGPVFFGLSVLSHSTIFFIPLSVCPNISVLKEFVISQNVDSGQIQ